MALGYLVILFVIIAVISIVCITLLFVVKDRRSNNAVFVITAILGILISYMSVTALPSNYVYPRIIAGSFGILSVIGIVLRYMKQELTAKVLVAASVALGVLQIFFF